MTAMEFSRVTNGTGPEHAHGWMVSLLCHFLGVGGVLLMMAEIEKPALPTPFLWEVAMVEASPSAVPSPVEPAPAPPDHRPLKREVESQPLVESVVPVQQAVHDVASTVEAREPIQQAVREVAAPVESAMEHPAIQSTESQAVVERAVTATTSTMERAEPVEGRNPVETAPLARVSESVEHVSPSVETVSSAVAHRVVQQRLVQYRQIQADYGWLRDTLWSRIEELKQYPTQARKNHWEGKVVVEAVIQADGAVVGLKVAESSGWDILDQEAMTVMRKASPLTLKHPLGKPQLTILVPISYRLDG
ncbi:MAG: energy transducer TonB [Nitrospiraceae bacterium]